jgi:hypothetical protein
MSWNLTLVIKIWTRGQNLAQKSKFSELPQNKQVRSPRRHEPNATRLGSNRTSDERDIAICSNLQTGKKKVLTVQSVRTLTWQAVRHVAGRTTRGRQAFG